MPPMILSAGPTPRLWKNAEQYGVSSCVDHEAGRSVPSPVLNMGNEAPTNDRKRSLLASTDAT